MTDHIEKAKKRWPGETLYACECHIAPGSPQSEGSTCFRCHTKLRRIENPIRQSGEST